MIISDIPVGKIVELEVVIGEHVHHINSKVEYGEGDELYISQIKNGTSTVNFKDCYNINLVYNSEKGLYIWRNVKVVSKVAGNDMFHCIKSEVSGAKYNRRNAFRVFIGEKTQVMILKDSMGNHINKLMGATIKDISEGGIGIILKEKAYIGSDISCIIKGEDEKGIKVHAKVVRCEYTASSNEYIWGCKLNETSPELVKYIFNKQRKNLKGRRI